MFYDNLKLICDKKGLKITPIVAECGGAKGSISNWKKGAMPNSDIVAKLAVRLNVSTDSLIFGDICITPLKLTADEQELLSLFNELPKKEQQRLIGRAAQLAELSEEHKKIDTISLKYNGSYVSAGYGDELQDYEQWDNVLVPETPESRKADFILIVDGDSMQPKFNDGDLVLVRSQPAVDEGQVGIFGINGRGYVKKFGKNCLISLNDKYEEIPIHSDDFKCFGLVLGTTEIIED
ncbi:MAG: S24 family peptidase [Huintestinicola sp.]